jgi:hypothetical protein
MNSQNIFKFYGSKLDLRLDSSEFYDYELGKVDADFDSDVIDFDNEITYSSLVIDSDCLSTDLDTIKPWVVEINEDYTGYTCDFLVRKRTEHGWTLDFVFNREDLPWVSGSTFYYWGISGETEPDYYLDNNLSFSFTTDGRIKWESYRYSGYCDSTSGYTETSYISSGQTDVLCTTGTSEDFNITITFKRNYKYSGCSITNEGGSNDLITGYTVTNPYDVITGATEEFELIEVLNKNWNSEKDRRLGTLKIYLNGKPIYKLKNWEEIVPSTRNSTNPIVQSWGGGTLYSGNLHSGTTEFNMKRVLYFEEPLNYPNIFHHYKVSTAPLYNIIECNGDCIQNITFMSGTGVLTEEGDYLMTEDNNILVY